MVLDQNIDTSTPQGTLMFQMLASFAEFENNLRKERQLEGIQKAKEQGKPFGRPLKVDNALIENVKAAIEKGITVSRILKFYKISQTTYYRIKSGYYDALIKQGASGLIIDFGTSKSAKIESLPSAVYSCLLYTSPSPRDGLLSRMPSSA